MTMMRKGCSLILVCLLITACGRSEESKFYALNPIPYKAMKGGKFKNIPIAINAIEGPGYVQQPQLVVRQTPYRLKLEEYQRWAESLNTNIGRVLETNLNTLLPGAIVEVFPWDPKFRPKYSLQVNIIKFEVDSRGRGVLRANYIIYHQDKSLLKNSVSYQRTIKTVTYENIVASMNHLMTRFSRRIARSFRRTV